MIFYIKMMKCYVTLIFTIQIIILGYVNGQQQQELTTSSLPPGGYYKTRYDHLDVENVLNQKRLVQYYAACLLNKGPCTPQGIEFRQILPEAIATNCLRCTEKQRFVINRTIRRLRKEYPNIWSELQAMWDPTGEKVKILEESLAQYSPRPSITSSSSSTTINNGRPSIITPTSSTATPTSIVTRQSTTLEILDSNVLADRFGNGNGGSLGESLPDSSPTSIILNVLTNSTNNSKGSTTRSPIVNALSTNANNEGSSDSSGSSTNIRSTQTTTRTFIPLSLPTTTASTITTRRQNNINNAPTLKPINNFANSAVSSVLLNNPLSTLTSLGNKVVETGTRIAGVVIDTVQNVVGIQLPKVRIF